MAPPLSTAASRRFVRLASTLGLGIPVALAPLLGTQAVPLFRPLVSVLSREQRFEVVPFSLFIVTIVALTLEFYFREKITDRTLRWLFPSCLVALLATVAVLFTLQSSHIVSVPYEGGRRIAGFVVTETRLPRCRCPSELSDVECIAMLSVDPRALSSCWGGPELQSINLRLKASYLLAIFLFTSLVGIVVLQVVDKERRLAGRQARRRKAKPPQARGSR